MKNWGMWSDALTGDGAGSWKNPGAVALSVVLSRHLPFGAPSVL